jgi:hypothetical protein
MFTVQIVPVTRHGVPYWSAIVRRNGRFIGTTQTRRNHRIAAQDAERLVASYESDYERARQVLGIEEGPTQFAL